MDYTVAIDAVGAADVGRVGGKAANLGELARAEFPVPAGFCVTTEAYRAFVEVGAGAAMPEGVRNAVVAAWEALGAERGCAVRSSATAEDQPGASFAGLFDTVLNVCGREALLEAVQRCWRSLTGERAARYCARLGLAAERMAMGVVVQKMVQPEAAGVLFTADPARGGEAMAIEAAFGLGEAVVAGLVTPDHFRVDRRSGAVLERRIGDKRVAVVAQAGGGTRPEALGDDRRRTPALTEAQIAALADLGRRIEAHFGAPQDVEWCFEDGRPHVLQSRPIGAA